MIHVFVMKVASVRPNEIAGPDCDGLPLTYTREGDAVRRYSETA